MAARQRYMAIVSSSPEEGKIVREENQLEPTVKNSFTGTLLQCFLNTRKTLRTRGIFSYSGT